MAGVGTLSPTGVLEVRSPLCGLDNSLYPETLTSGISEVKSWGGGGGDGGGARCAKCACACACV